MLARCLLEWIPPPEPSIDAEAAAFVIAEVVLHELRALTAKPKKR